MFNDDQLKELQRLSDKKDYPAAYDYRKKGARKKGTDLFFSMVLASENKFVPF